MRFAEFEMELVDGPHPKEIGKPFKRLLVNQKYLKIGHHVRHGDEYYIILEMKPQIERDMCMNMEAFASNFKFKQDKLKLNRLIK